MTERGGFRGGEKKGRTEMVMYETIYRGLFGMYEGIMRVLNIKSEWIWQTCTGNVST